MHLQHDLLETCFDTNYKKSCIHNNVTYATSSENQMTFTNKFPHAASLGEMDHQYCDQLYQISLRFFTVSRHNVKHRKVIACFIHTCIQNEPTHISSKWNIQDVHDILWTRALMYTELVRYT